MRIVEFCVGRPRTDSSNGVELSVFRLSETLAVDNDVLTVCLSDKPVVEIPGASVINQRPKGMLAPVPPELVASVVDWRPDIVHLHSVYTMANTHLARILRYRGIPYLVTPHGGYGRANEKHRRLAKLAYRAIYERKMLDGAEFIHSVGDIEDIARVGSRTEVVETTKGLDVPTRKPSPQGSDDVSGFQFGFVGRLDPLHKGLDMLLDAFARSELDDASLVLVGPSHQDGQEKLEAQVAELGIADKVTFTGPLVGDIKESTVFEMDVFAHVSRWEGGIPYAVLEAAASSRPLLLTKAADPHGALVGVGGAVVVEPTIEAVSEAMATLKSLPTTALRDMGEKGKRYVMANFSWDRMGAQLIEALSDRGIGAG